MPFGVYCQRWGLPPVPRLIIHLSTLACFNVARPTHGRCGGYSSSTAEPNPYLFTFGVSRRQGNHGGGVRTGGRHEGETPSLREKGEQLP